MAERGPVVGDWYRGPEGLVRLTSEVVGGWAAETATGRPLLIAHAELAADYVFVRPTEEVTSCGRPVSLSDPMQRALALRVTDGRRVSWWERSSEVQRKQWRDAWRAALEAAPPASSTGDGGERLANGIVWRLLGLPSISRATVRSHAAEFADFLVWLHRKANEHTTAGRDQCRESCRGRIHEKGCPNAIPKPGAQPALDAVRVAFKEARPAASSSSVEGGSSLSDDELAGLWRKAGGEAAGGMLSTEHWRVETAVSADMLRRFLTLAPPPSSVETGGLVLLLVDALRPFAGCLTTEDGQPVEELISDWFGRADFLAARRAVRVALAKLAATPPPPVETGDGREVLRVVARSRRDGSEVANCEISGGEAEAFEAARGFAADADDDGPGRLSYHVERCVVGPWREVSAPSSSTTTNGADDDRG